MLLKGRIIMQEQNSNTAITNMDTTYDSHNDNLLDDGFSDFQTYTSTEKDIKINANDMKVDDDFDDDFDIAPVDDTFDATKIINYDNSVTQNLSKRLASLEEKVDKILDILLSGKFVPMQEVAGLASDTQQLQNDILANSPTQESVQDATQQEEISDQGEIEDEPLDSVTTTMLPLVDNEEEYDPDAWIKTVSAEQRIKPKFSFEMKLRISNDETKEFYSEIKNELMSYGLHCRMSRFRENFNKNRNQIARLVINGKTLKCYLGIDPKSLDEKYYHHKDVSDKKGTADLPTLINVKSKIAIRKIKELLEIITEEYMIFKKKKFEPTDYANQLATDGYSKLELKGYDYMIKPAFTREDAHNLPDFFAEQFINNVKIDTNDQPIKKCNIDLKLLCDNFSENNTVDLQTLIAKNIIPDDCNFISIKASDTMDKPLTICCDDITPTAAKMIFFSGGTVFRNTTNEIDAISFDDTSMEDDFDDLEELEDFE